MPGPFYALMPPSSSHRNPLLRICGMKTVIELLQGHLDKEGDADKKAEFRRAVEILSRAENATEKDDRKDMRDPDYQQVGNMPKDGENAFAERNRMEGEVAKHVKVEEETPPPAEARPMPKKG